MKVVFAVGMIGVEERDEMQVDCVGMNKAVQCHGAAEVSRNPGVITLGGDTS